MSTSLRERLGQKVKEWNKTRKSVQKVLFRKKPVELALNETSDQTKALKKVLNSWDLISIGVGCTIGAGIFVLTGKVAKDVAGPAVFFSYLFAGLSCIFSGFCYAEFAARIPVAGSAYMYAYCTMGEYIAWFIGWNLILEYLLATSAVARGCSGYLVSFFKIFGVSIPKNLYNIEFMCNDEGHCNSIDIFSGLIIMFFTFFCCLGTKGSSILNIIMLVIVLASIIFIIITGSIYVEPTNWSNFFPYGFKGSMQGAGIIFFAYVGFDAVSTVAEEVPNPQKQMPIGIIGTILISTALYSSVSLVLTGMVHYSELDENAPLSEAFSRYNLEWAQVIVSIGAFLALATSIVTSIIGLPRILMAMARDGLLFKIFEYVHPRFNTPFYSTIITGVLAALLAMFVNLELLADMVSIGTLMAFIAVCASVIILRVKSPEKPKTGTFLTAAYITLISLCLTAFKYDAHLSISLILLGISLVPAGMLFFQPHTNKPVNSYACPLVPLVPLLGLTANLYMTISLSYMTWVRLIVWFVFGTILYVAYGVRNSRIKDYENRMELLGTSTGDSGVSLRPIEKEDSEFSEWNTRPSLEEY